MVVVRKVNSRRRTCVKPPPECYLRSREGSSALAVLSLNLDASRRVKCDHFREDRPASNCDNDATMDGSLDDWLQQRETVDVETRAIVSSLVTAVCCAFPPLLRPSRH